MERVFSRISIMTGSSRVTMVVGQLGRRLGGGHLVGVEAEGLGHHHDAVPHRSLDLRLGRGPRGSERRALMAWSSSRLARFSGEETRRTRKSVAPGGGVGPISTTWRRGRLSRSRRR
jgi:hypothetical protein